MPGPYTTEDVRRTFKAQDAWWTVLLVDPLAGPLVKLVANRTRITPNQLSVAAFVLGLVAACLFYLGEWRWLALGAVLVYLAFLLDCMDGKIARLKGTGTPFGMWLDFVFDRTRMFCCTLGLMIGQWQRHNQPLYLVLGMCLLFVGALRFLSSFHSGKLRAYMRDRLVAAEREHRGLSASADDEPVPYIEDVLTGDPALDADAVAARGGVVDLQAGFRARFGFFNRMRSALLRHRIRPYLWSGIEFEMFVMVVAPLTGLVAPVCIAAGALLLLFEAGLVVKLLLSTRDFSRQLAAYERPETVSSG